jgi:hypothetical protein
VSRQGRKSGNGRKVGLGLLAVALTIGLGCSTDNIMGPMSATAPDDGSFSDGGSYFTIIPDPQGKLDLGTQQVNSVKGASALVSAKDGGLVSLGRFSVEIPPGALDRDTAIQISVPDPSLVMCRLEPHGLRFNKPVTLTINYGGTEAEQLESSSPSLGTYWYNDGEGNWELVGKRLDRDQNLSHAELEHFSDYAQAWEH